MSWSAFNKSSNSSCCTIKFYEFDELNEVLIFFNDEDSGVYTLSRCADPKNTYLALLKFCELDNASFIAVRIL